MDLFLIDAIAPFFQGPRGRKTNWSKVPFDRIHPDADPDGVQWERIVRDMDTFCGRVAALGYNAVTVDDVAHLAHDPVYEAAVARAIGIHRARYRRLFEVVRGHGLSLYVTMDVLSYTPAMRRAVGTAIGPVSEFMARLLDGFLADFPEVRGVILRVGECDGLDVRHDFRSRLVLKRPGHVKRLLRRVLPVFERAGRELVFRTWTVGAYRIGDLIWHRKRLREIFNAVRSDALTLSMKYGESDFFRYLPVNSHFFRVNLPTLVELQARREYEGSGEYPSFVGGDHADIAAELRTAPNLRGLCVWCQTGGWTPFGRRAFLDDDAVWTEINTAVTIDIFKNRTSPGDAARRWAADHHVPDADALVDLLGRSERLVKRLLYIPDFASQKLFFRRVRVPPLLHVYWNSLFINHSLRRILSHFVGDPEGCVRDGHEALAEFEPMIADARACGLPVGDIEFMRDTFRLFALAREYYFGPYDESVRERLKAAKRQYKKAYPKSLRPRYKIRMNFEPFPVSRRSLRLFAAVALRRRRGYRIIDQILTLRFLSLVYRLASDRGRKIIPKFARKSAMGVDTLFR